MPQLVADEEIVNFQWRDPRLPLREDMSPLDVEIARQVMSREGPARSAVLHPGEAVEDEIECELELGVVIAAAEGAAVGDGEGHLYDVGVAGAECAGEGGGCLWFEVAGIVEQGLGEPEQVAAEDVCLRQG